MSTFTGTGNTTADPSAPRGPHRVLLGLPQHLKHWDLPPGWRWGEHGVSTGPRHAQEVIDAFGRSLALLSAPDAKHADWLFAEARSLAHLNHPLFPTTYHFWTPFKGSTRGPGYLRRWITGETVGDRLRRTGQASVPEMIRVMRTVGSGLAYLHDIRHCHGAVAPDALYITPTGRLWLLGWQWAAGVDAVPKGLRPDPVWMPGPSEWGDSWDPTPLSDQWQLGALCFAMLAGELPPRESAPPVYLVRPDCPASIAQLVDRMLSSDPAARFESVAELLKTLERLMPGTTTVALSMTDALTETDAETDEDRLRWATGIDYEVLSKLGSGTFGSVWRVRDLSLEREVALKMLHPRASESEEAIARFIREARLAANLKHPAIVPVYDMDRRGDVVWYTMELQERGSLAELVGRNGARLLGEIADEVDTILEALAVAHARGIIHRDLKPENILIDRYRNWRIADFGIANAFGEQHAGASGTPAFAAPEQLLGEAQGPATDLFAVAAIVYYALTARPPFAGDEAPAVLAQQLGEQVDLTGFGPDLARWLQQGLHADASARYSDAFSMQMAWRHVVRHVSRS
jgi:eukaryotic-like serine/threonine-protein kinase